MVPMVPPRVTLSIQPTEALDELREAPNGADSHPQGMLIDPDVYNQVIQMVSCNCERRPFGFLGDCQRTVSRVKGPSLTLTGSSLA